MVLVETLLTLSYFKDWCIFVDAGHCVHCFYLYFKYITLVYFADIVHCVFAFTCTSSTLHRCILLLLRIVLYFVDIAHCVVFC